ncbi:MAG: hypothetical protein EXQ47_04580 [Bryobacterales bacterium]|nr:hypothetical protein [Bryobacterales bacterium]
MSFDATPLNITTLLVSALAVAALSFLIKGRYDSNLPLLFYAATLVLTSATDRGLNTYLLYSGIAAALVLRFEFMGKGFTKFIGILNSSAISLILISFFDDMFGDGRGFF